jgi:arginyl-tRNA synthetase
MRLSHCIAVSPLAKLPILCYQLYMQLSTQSRMPHPKETWKRRVAAALNSLLAGAGLPETVDPASVIAEDPPRPEMGDIGFPMFGYAKLLRQGPPQTAAALAAKLAADGGSGGTAEAGGPYVNVRLDRGAAAAAVLPEILGGKAAGRPGTLAGSRIMVEFSSPNTNKPLHLGHLRNDLLGESLSRILAACGAEVRKVCIINDRGIHICKSMLAYREQGGGAVPESAGVKSDRFVGDWYVRYNEMAKTDPGAEGRAQELLRKWEAGGAETVSLWKTMNAWAIGGMKATYKRTGVSFDQYYFESETYLKGKEEILKGLEKGIFCRAEDGAVLADLEAEKLGRKVLLRADGTSIYITQDIGLAVYRSRDWPFDRLVYVVGSEQQYHFKALFTILDKLGFPWAKNLFHLSYGMVNLPEGRMKSREGTVVDADDLLDSLRDMAVEEIREKEREEEVGNIQAAAEKIALGALHYFLLSVSPSKDMTFNPRESLSFNGDTGPYLQYMGARISSMLRKAVPAKDGAAADYALLTGDPEWELVKVLSSYNEALAQAAENMDPSLAGTYLYNLSRTFSRFYHDCPILQASPPALAAARLDLARAALVVLKDAMNLVCIPFLESM